MQSAQLRDLVIDRIYGINDVRHLEKIMKVLDVKSPQKEIYYLNKQQKEGIKEGREQVSRGEFVSNEDLENEEDQWLNG